MNDEHDPQKHLIETRLLQDCILELKEIEAGIPVSIDGRDPQEIITEAYSKARKIAGFVASKLERAMQ